MNYLGVNYELKHIPALDPEFIPFGIWADAYRKGAAQPVAIAVERHNGLISVRNTFIHGTDETADADYRFTDNPHFDAEANVLTATVPEGHVFVMGDNRNWSRDSRDSDIGFVDTRCILGRVLLRLDPFTVFSAE